jgi:hypothetical protein
VNIDPGYVCIPVKGTMRATYLGTEADYDAVSAFLSYHIGKVMNSSAIKEGGVEKAVYLGSRYIPAPVIPISSASSREADNSFGTTSVALASGLSGAAIFGMLVIFFLIARRRRQKSSRSEIEPTPAAEAEKQVRISSVEDESNSPPVVVTVTKSLGSGDFDDDASDRARFGGDIESAHHLGQQPPDQEVPSSSTPYPMSSAYSISTARTASITKDSSTDGSQAFDDEQTEKVANLKDAEDDAEVPTSPKTLAPAPPPVIDILPPKHPTGPTLKPPNLPTSASKPIGKRRKKKKKKKQQLIRSSSRENVVEMETITEGEEETSDNKDEEGSEYSWCSTSDSDPGSNPGSRDPSPARSSGSREASPARSSGNDAVNMGGGSMSWDSNQIGLAATSSSDSDSTSKPNKPYRLPPKWI